MKNLLLSFALLLALHGSAQVRTFSPTGTRMSDPNPISVIGSTALTTLYTDSISANNLSLGKYYSFRIDLAATTPLVNVGTITITLKYGTGTLVVANGAVLVGSLNNAPIIITGTIVSRGLNSQYVTMNISQPNGTVINLPLSSSAMRGIMSVDASVTQNVTVTLQLGGTVTGTTITRDFAVRYDF